MQIKEFSLPVSAGKPMLFKELALAFGRQIYKVGQIGSYLYFSCKILQQHILYMITHIVWNFSFNGYGVYSLSVIKMHAKCNHLCAPKTSMEPQLLTKQVNSI